MHDYKFTANCFDSTPRVINRMVDIAQEVTLRTFILHVDLKDLYTVLPYGPHASKTAKVMKLKYDGDVRFFKSTFDGQTCYYVDWSGIEFVFVEGGQYVL